MPDHIFCFGPAILFATEGFESFNAVIWSYSVHSNPHSPSCDIAKGMACGNHIRKILSGSFFVVHPLDTKTNRKNTVEREHRTSESPWMDSVFLHGAT